MKRILFQRIGGKPATTSNQSEARKKKEQKLASESELARENKQTIREKIASKIELHCSDTIGESNESYNTTSMANRPSLRTLYSINQVEVIQSLRKYTFAAKTNRLPSPWRAKIKNISGDENDYLYRDERLIIPKVL